MPSSARFPATSRSALALVALLAVAAAVVLGVRSSASADAPVGTTIAFEELERGSTFTHVRNSSASSGEANLQGDVLAFTNPLADRSGARIGLLSVSCVTTTGARDFTKSTLTCSGIVQLRDGMLALQASTRPGATTTVGAVTGGTGAYAGARGTFASQSGRHGASDTVTLLD